MFFSELLSVLQLPAWQTSPKNTIEQLVIDSRKLFLPENALFVAIKGQNHDGHRYIAELYQKGVRNFIVESEKHIEAHYKTEGINFIKVKNSLRALQKIAAYHRGKFAMPVVAITGSNGKTIVKEWLAQLLSEEFNIVRSPKSYNSQVGVPLSVWQMSAEHTLGIFEAGISQKDEMKHLEAVLQPNIGILTNIGTAHDEGFESKEQKLEEKLHLFRNVARLYIYEPLQILYPKVFEKFLQKNSGVELITWKYVLSKAKTVLSFHKQANHILLRINAEMLPFQDEAYLQNTGICAVFLHHWAGFSATEITARILQLKPISMRLELKQGLQQTYIIDDSYNNDLAGLQIALDFLSNQTQKTAKVLILSDILQSDLTSKKLYEQVAQMIVSNKIGFFVGIGQKIMQNKECFSEVPLQSFYASTEEFLEQNILGKFKNCVILVKGARKFSFERIVQRLEQKVHRTVLEINLDALVHNLNFYRSQLAPNTRIMAMVKAFAYGSGSVEIANLLQFHRVDYLAVAYTDEAVELRKNGIYLPIMVLSPSESSFPLLSEYDLEPVVYSFEMLDKLIAFGEQEAISLLKIHIEFDTGMKRLGFERKNTQKLMNTIKQKPFLKVSSVFSHLAAADEALHDAFSGEQISSFEKIIKKIKKQLPYPFTRHILNSSGITRFAEAQMDMVRLGVGLYGVEAGGAFQNKLRPISRLKTVISQIKCLKKGETVGYSRRGVAQKAMQIGVIGIGYADGFSRAFGNGRGKVKINEHLVPVVGNVCMDMCMIDITGLDAKVGDEVIIFDENFSINELASFIGTIPYEILTSVSERVKRVFYSQ